MTACLGRLVVYAPHSQVHANQEVPYFGPEVAYSGHVTAHVNHVVAQLVHLVVYQVVHGSLDVAYLHGAV